MEPNENDDLRPQVLSGDENAEQNEKGVDTTASKANLFFSIMTIMKTTVGVGIVSLPYTFSRLGWLLSFFLFIVSITLIQFTIILLLKSKNLSRHSNYTSIGHHALEGTKFEKWTRSICSFAILFNNLGVCIIQLIIFKGTMKQIVDSYIPDDKQWIKDQFYTNPIFFVFIMALIEVLLTFVSKIEKLRIFAFIGISGILTFIIIVFIIFIQKMSSDEHNWKCNSDVTPFETHTFEIISVLPNFIISLGYHTNLFPVFKGMKNASDAKMKKGSLMAIIGCACFYSIAGIMGYCMYGRGVESNFLLAFKRKQMNEVLFVFLNIGFLLSVFFSFAVVYFAARNNFIAIVKTIIKWYLNRRNKNQQSLISEDENEQDIDHVQNTIRRWDKWIFRISNIVLFLFAVIIAITVDSIQDVFNFVGGIATNFILFFFPSLIYILLVKKYNKQKKRSYSFATAICIFSVPFAIFAITANYIG